MGRNEQKKSGLITAGLVIGIIGLVLSAVPIINNFAAILGVLAIIFGTIGIVGAKKRDGAGRGMSVAVLIIGVVCIGIVLASQAMYGKALNDAGKSIQDSVDTSSGKKTDELLKNDVNIEIGKFSATADEYGINKTSLNVKVTNKNAETKSYTVKIEAVDASGTRLAEDTIYANDLKGNGAGSYEAFKYVESDKVDSLKTATFKVYSVGQS